MKTIKFLAALAIMMGFGMSAMAQQSDFDVTAAKAEVVAQVNVTKVLELLFGMVTPGVTKSISTTGTLLAGNAGTSTFAGSEQQGHFTVTKGANTWVTLTLSLPATLTDGTTTPNILPINFSDVSGTPLGLLKTGANDVPFTPVNGNQIQLTSGAYSAFFAATSFDVFLGGTVVPATSQVAGNYTGNITLIATYN
jgi:hypothetical protein